MITRCLLIVFLLSSVSTLKADYGNCVVYHARFQLNNGSAVEGYFEAKYLGEYCVLNAKKTNKWCNNSGVFEVYQKVYNSSNPTIHVYKKIHYINPRPRYKKPKVRTDIYRYVFPEDMLDIPPAKIRKMTFLSAEYSRGDWMMSGVVVGSAGILDTIKQLQYWQFATLQIASDNQKTRLIFLPDSSAKSLDDGCYFIFNYNSQVNMAEIKRLVTLKFSYNRDALYDQFRARHHIPRDRSCPSDLRKQFEQDMENRQKEALQWLMQRGIVLVGVHDTC